MKYLIPAFIIFLASCSKNELITPTTNSVNNGDLFYRVTESDIDGTIATTEIKHINVLTDNFTTGDGDGHEHNQHDSTHCPLAIDFSTFNVSKNSSNSVIIEFGSLNEENVKNYQIEKSLDSKVWNVETILEPKGTNNYYSYIDKY